MKYFFLLFFFIFVSCSSSKHTYMCGDRPCLDKKEFKNYFSENLVVEIQTNNSQKATIDLVKLNTKEEPQQKKVEDPDLKSKNLNYKDRWLKKKIKKNKLKEARAKLQNERNIKKTELKIKTKKEKKLMKLKGFNASKKEKKIAYKKIKNQKISKKLIKTKSKKMSQTMNKKNNKKLPFKSTISEDKSSICQQIKDCNIEKITELLTKKGREKDFPNINSK